MSGLGGIDRSLMLASSALADARDAVERARSILARSGVTLAVARAVDEARWSADHAVDRLEDSGVPLPEDLETEAAATPTQPGGAS